MQAQVKRHFMRRFAGCDQPAGKCVFTFCRGVKRNLMRADSGMGQRIRDTAGRSQLAIPRVYCDKIGSHAASRSDVLASGQPRRGNSLWAFEELMLGAAGNHFAAVQHKQIAAKAEGFLHVVRYKDHRAVVVGERLAQLFFRLPSQMRIKRRKRLIEEQGVGLDGHASRDCYALPLATGDLGRIAIGKFGDVHLFKLPSDAHMALAFRQFA